MRKKRLLPCLGVALVAGLLVPAAPFTRDVLLGLARREPFYGLRPASAWEKALADWEQERQHIRPGPDAEPPAVLQGGEHAVPVLTALLGSEHEAVRVRVAEALLPTPASDPAVAVLVDALRSEQELLRLAAAGALSRRKAAAEETVPALLGALHDPSPAVREVAAETLKALDRGAAAHAGLCPEDEVAPLANRVVCFDAARRVRWSAPVEADLGRRPPHLAWDAQRVYVTDGDGVTARDRGTGQALWHAPGPADRLCLSRDLLVAADGGTAADLAGKGRWLVARTSADGVEVFRVRLPVKEFDPGPIRELAGRLLVQREGIYGTGNGWYSIDRGGPYNVLKEDLAVPWDGFLFDRSGRVVHRLDRHLLGVPPAGDGQVFLSAQDVVRLAPDGRAGWVGWSVPFRASYWEPTADGGLVDLPGGGVLAFLYGRTSDSGVHLLRLDPVAGRVGWQAFSACFHPRRVLAPGSPYAHRVTVAVEGDRVRVTSRGSHGTFLEVLDLATGRQLSRRRY
jgi:hypothetical protein